jgi:predicted TIM-barrel fold metal-dependent hydrolase
MAVIDVHAHFEPRMLDLPAMRSKLKAAGVDRVALIPAMNDPLPHTPEALLSLLRALMRSRLHAATRLLEKVFYTADGDLKLQGKVIRIYAEPDNQMVADAVAGSPDLFLGWIFLNPMRHDPVEELEKWRHRPGMIGVKLHPFWHRYPVRELIPIARRCEELKLPVLIHLGDRDRGDWKVLTDAAPQLRIIFAHAGMPHFQRMWDEVRLRPNLYVDLSSPYLSENLIRDAVAALGPRRALYGTDAPYGFPEPDHSYSYTRIKRWVERLPGRAEEIDRMLGGNVAELLSYSR